MLLLLDYLRNDDIKVLQTKDGECILPILKNGSQSLHRLAKKYPMEYQFIPLDSSVKKVTVFLRDPIERFCSGLNTQSQLYSIDISVLLERISNGKIPIIDDHILPQFYFLLRIPLRRIKFSFKSISELNQLKNIEHINQSKNNINLSQTLKNRIRHFLTDDAILYDKFLDNNAMLHTVINEIKKESNYIKDIKYFDRVVKLYME